jgi:phosphoribosylformylglycinamidine synthase
MKIRVEVILKPNILDPQGITIKNALQSLGFQEVVEVRQGKIVELEINSVDSDYAFVQAESICRALLVNPVTEQYSIEIRP